MATKAFLEKAYLAYFGRPVDPTGLTDYANSTDTQVADAFAASAESKALYGTTFNYAQINAIYLALFNREAEKAGLEYWYAKVADKTYTAAGAAIAILNGAQNADKTAIENKLAASAAFSAALDTNTEMIGYSGDAAAASARSFLSTVTTTAATAAAVDAAVASAVAARTAVAGQTFTLTTSADILNTVTTTAANRTTAGDDIIYGIADATLTSSDVIDGGAGTDTINAGATAASQTLAPVLTSVETVTITHTVADGKTLAFSAANATGLTLVNIKNAGAHSDNAGDEGITVSNLAKTTTFGIIGGTASAAATGAVLAATWASAAAADTQRIAISAAGKATSLTLSTAETVEITATGTGSSGANTLGTLAATAVKTLNITGAGTLTIGASDLAGTSTATVTINSSTSTGIISFAGESGSKHVFTGGSGATTVTLAGTADDSVTTGAGADTITIATGNDTVVAGAGNDKVILGAQTDITALDSVDGGEGADTISTTTATIDATTRTELAKGSKNFEIIETTATALATINFQTVSVYDTARVSGAMAAAYNGTAATAGTNSVAATMENADVLIISAARAGQSGGAKADGKSTSNGAAAIGGDGIVVTPHLDGGSNVASLKFVGNADINGGVGELSKGTATTDIGGTGGTALNAANIETLNITLQGTQSTSNADTVTFTAGAGGANGTGGTAGADGNTVVVSTNATINLYSELDPLTSTATKHNSIDLGTVKGTNVTINGGNFLGGITVTARDGNVTITTGLGTDVVAGGTGTDVIVLGAGNDTYINTADGANTTAGDQISVGGGFDTVTFIGSAASAANYAAAPNVSDFTVGDRADNTDLIRLSSTDGSYSAGLSVDGTAAGASGGVGVSNLAINTTLALGTTNTFEFLKLTTGVAFVTSLQLTFNAAIGTGQVTEATNGVYGASFYDTTNSRMVIVEVNTGNGTNTVIETGDVVRLIGTINMSAADYALIDTDNFASLL